MAKSTENTVNKKNSKAFCGIAFTQHGRNTHLSAIPKEKTRNLTQDQCDDQTRLIQAVNWAIMILGDNKKCAKYVNRSARTGKAPFSIALNDCLKKLKNVKTGNSESM
jgi:hypothetical protein